jgi:hypothetical protein
VSISGGSSREEEDGARRMQLIATFSSLAGISKLEEEFQRETAEAREPKR